MCYTLAAERMFYDSGRQSLEKRRGRQKAKKLDNAAIRVEASDLEQIRAIARAANLLSDEIIRQRDDQRAAGPYVPGSASAA